MCCWKTHVLSLSYALLVLTQCYRIASGKDNDARKTYVVRYKNGESTIPVTVVLDYKKQAEYVINMNTRTPTKSVTFYDFKQKSIAYKDMRNKECFIGKLTNETLQTENDVLQRLQNPLDLNPLPLKLDSSRSSLSATEVRNFAGQKIAMFCRKMAAWLLQEPPNFRRNRRQAAAAQRIEKTFSHHGQEKHEYSKYGHETYKVSYYTPEETSAQAPSSTIERDASHVGNSGPRSEALVTQPSTDQASQGVGIYRRQHRRRYGHHQQQQQRHPTNTISDININRVPNAYYHENPTREDQYSHPIRYSNIDGLSQRQNSSTTGSKRQNPNLLTQVGHLNPVQQGNGPTNGFNLPISYPDATRGIHSNAIPSSRHPNNHKLFPETSSQDGDREGEPERVIPSPGRTWNNSEREVENIVPFNVTGEERRIDSDVVLKPGLYNRKSYDPDAIPTNERIVAAPEHVRSSNPVIPASVSNPYPKYFSVYNNHRADIPSEDSGFSDPRNRTRTSTVARPLSSGSSPKRGRHHNVLQLFTPDEIVIDVGKIPKKPQFPFNGMRTPSYPNSVPGIRNRNFSKSSGRVWQGRVPQVRVAHQPGNVYQSNNRVPYRRKAIPVPISPVQQQQQRRQPLPRLKAALPPGVSLYPRHPNAPFADYADPSVRRQAIPFATNTIRPPTQHRQRHFRKKQRTPFPPGTSCCEPGNSQCCSHQGKYPRNSYQRSCCASMMMRSAAAAPITRSRQQRRLGLSSKGASNQQVGQRLQPRTMSPEEICDRKKMCRTLYQSAQAVKVCRQPDVPGC